MCCHCREGGSDAASLSSSTVQSLDVEWAEQGALDALQSMQQEYAELYQEYEQKAAAVKDGQQDAVDELQDIVQALDAKAQQLQTLHQYCLQTT